ncbi:MAG: response regulator [Bacteroidota bacterium]|nr:response regulator [Bacteroidota bacterium]
MLLNKLPYHILLGDDDDEDAVLFEEAITEIDSKILLSHTGDGHQVLTFLHNVIPDILFLDLNMPNMNGIECLKNIRAIKHFDSLPIFIYSTSKNPQYVNACYKEGATGYIVKPIKYTDIVKMLKQIFTNGSNIKKRDKETFIIE